jgi:hypothetical protein
MSKITATGTPLEDCSVLSIAIKNGAYATKNALIQLERKYRYKFVSIEEKEAVREFYDRFVVKNNNNKKELV